MANKQGCTTYLQQQFSNEASYQPQSYSEKLCANTNPSDTRAYFDRAYQRLFGVDFCEAAGQLPLKWSDADLQFAIAFERSMRVSKELDFFLEYKEIENKKIKMFGKDYSYPYVKIRMPDQDNDMLDLVGIHGNLFWLTKFSTTPLNQHLHRAKIIWHSWFCQKIAPDNARVPIPKAYEDMTAVEKEQWDKFQSDIAAVQDYFAADDTHAKGDQLCFNCHRDIQPVANYFGRLSMRDGDNDKRIADYFEHNAPHNRRGGLWQAELNDFMPESKGAGLPGLANMLRNLPKVRSCIVKSSWNHFFGRAHGLNDDEIAVGVKAFEDSNFNYRALLKHLLTTPEAKTYFVEGEQKFQDLRNSKSLTCEKATAQGKIDAKTIVHNSCDSCHRSDEYDVYYIDNFVEEGKLTRLDDIYRVVFNEQSMPRDGNFPPLDGLSPERANDVQRKILQCYLDKANVKGTPHDASKEQAKLSQQGHLVNGQEVKP